MKQSACRENPIRYIRKGRRITLKNLANAANMRYNRLFRLERGLTSLEQHECDALATALETNPAALMNAFTLWMSETTAESMASLREYLPDATQVHVNRITTTVAVSAYTMRLLHDIAVLKHTSVRKLVSELTPILYKEFFGVEPFTADEFQSRCQLRHTVKRAHEVSAYAAQGVSI